MTSLISENSDSFQEPPAGGLADIVDAETYDRPIESYSELKSKKKRNNTINCRLCGPQCQYDEETRRKFLYGKKESKCSLCTFRCKFSTCILKHVRIMHPGEEAFQCSNRYCTYKTSNPYRFRNHSMKCSRYKCSKCGFVSSHVGDLKKHTMTNCQYMMSSKWKEIPTKENKSRILDSFEPDLQTKVNSFEPDLQPILVEVKIENEPEILDSFEPDLQPNVNSFEPDLQPNVVEVKIEKSPLQLLTNSNEG